MEKLDSEELWEPLTPMPSASRLQAFCAALEAQLQPQLSVQVAQQLSTLYILLEAVQTPPPATVVRDVCNLLNQHSIGNAPADSDSLPIKQVRIYGREARTGDHFTDWYQALTLDQAQKLRLPDTPDLDSMAHHPQAQVSATDCRDTAPSSQTPQSYPIIVCGLGSLGQHCVVALKKFAKEGLAIAITAIDSQPPDEWEIEDLENCLAHPIVTGDCRRDKVLEAAGIQGCRAILVVTNDDSSNIETAIAARQLNPHVNIVIKSGQQNLNALLKQKLGHFVALEPIELPATTFTLAALGETILGTFKVEQFQFNVIKHIIADQADPFYDLPITRLQHDRKYQRLLYYPTGLKQATAQQLPSPVGQPAQQRSFHHWRPDSRFRVGDEIIYVEATEIKPIELIAAKRQYGNLLFSRKRWRHWLRLRDWQQYAQQFWQWIRGHRTRSLLAFGCVMGILLVTLSTVSLKLSGAVASWRTAVSTSFILLLGGYGDIFGGLEEHPIPPLVELLCFMITVSSLLFVLSVLGLAADSLLNSKFDFLRRRVPIPEAGHVVIVGEGRVAQRVAAVLQEVQQPFLFLANPDLPQPLELNAPIVYQHAVQGLSNVHLVQAKSVILATGNQMLNLEAALMAKHIASQANHHLNLVIRTNNQRFSNHLGTLLPDARNFCIYALSADAFVGAAFGENILSLFRLENSTILVTEFIVKAGDTLQSKLLSQVSYGYGVVPIYHEPAHRQPGQDSSLQLMPPEETILEVGDRLVLLATINGLRRIESGMLASQRRWQLQAIKPLDPRSSHYAGDILTNVTGCSLSLARHFMENLPQVLGLPGIMELELYDHQAYTLVQKLRKLLPIQLTSMPVGEEAVMRIDWRTCELQMGQCG